MKTSLKSFVITLLVIFCTSAGFIAGYITRTYQSTSQMDFPILKEGYTILRDQGLNPLPTPPAMEYGMIKGMVQAYGDPYTAFLEPVQNELESDSLRGSFGGIGVNIKTDAQGNYLLFPFPDSPAQKAGVQDGDRLLAVEKLSITPETPIDQLQAAVRGPVGEIVSITIGREPDYTPQTIQIKRAEIALPSVTWHIEPSDKRVGVFEINIIAESTPDEIKKAIVDLQGRGATHFIMDLRNNGGGLLNAGIEIARLFVAEGDIIQQQYRGKGIETYRADNKGEFADLPLVILVNQNTASAAEIISGSIQARQRAKLIGYPTYGKNTIQLIYNLRDNSSLHVTAAHWWIPGLEFPKGDHGLDPDISLPEGASEQEVVKAAIRVLFP